MSKNGVAVDTLILHARALRAHRRRQEARRSELAALTDPTPAERRERERLDLDLTQYLPARLGRLGRRWRGDPCPARDC